jgi:hypothetical protein
MAFLIGANTIINSNVSILHTTFGTVSGNTQSTQVKIKASDPQTLDLFGRGVAVGSGRIVVGAYADDDNGSGSGSAYLFNLSGTQLTKIKPSDGATQDYFGFSVSVGSGRIVAGAYGDSDNGFQAGSAYIFNLNGNQLAKITSSDNAAGDAFGISVAVGSGRIVVGANDDDDNGSRSGSAYLFNLSGTQLAKIKPSDGAVDDGFGYSVSVGSGHIVVGSNLDDDNGSNSGSAYIFDLNGIQLAKIKPSDGAADDFFGTSVSIGCGRIVVGAYGDDDNGSGSGSAYIFDLNGTQLAKIKASDAAAGDVFGFSVSVGSGHIVVGAYGADNNGSNSGSTYIFNLNGTQLAKLRASDEQATDLFGESVSVGSGYIVAGASQDDDTATNTGSAYVYRLAETMDSHFETISDTYRY